MIIHQTRLWWEMIERRKLEKLTWCYWCSLALCNVDIKWTQKRPVAIIVLVILIAAAVNFTVLHLIVWPQPSLGVTQCPLLSQLKSLFGWSLFPLVFWIIFPSLTLIENYVPVIYFCSLKFFVVLLVTDPCSSLIIFFP